MMYRPGVIQQRRMGVNLDAFCVHQAHSSDGSLRQKRRNVLQTINYTNHKTTAPKVALVRKKTRDILRMKQLLVHPLKESPACFAVPHEPIRLSSVPSERVFSKCGEIVRKNRNRPSPKSVERIMFLNKNL